MLNRTSLRISSFSTAPTTAGITGGCVSKETASLMTMNVSVDCTIKGQSILLNRFQLFVYSLNRPKVHQQLHNSICRFFKEANLTLRR